MDALSLVQPILVVVLCLIIAPWWALKKSRDFKKSRESSAYQEFFFSPLPPKWYLSERFWLGFSLAALASVPLFRFLL